MEQYREIISGPFQWMKVMDKEILVLIKIRQTTEGVRAFVCMCVCACMCMYVCVLHEARREMRRRKQCEGSGKEERGAAVAGSTAIIKAERRFPWINVQEREGMFDCTGE